MIEEKLLATEDRPINIFGGSASISFRRSCQSCDEFGPFGLRGPTRQTAEVSFIDQVRPRFASCQLFADNIVLGFELLVNRVAIGNMQHLGHAGGRAALALTSLFP